MSCRDCEFALDEPTGQMTEVPGCPGEYVEWTDLVCRRYPAKSSLFSTYFPKAKAKCGEFKEQQRA